RLLQSLVRQGDMFAVYVIDPDNSIREHAHAASYSQAEPNLSRNDLIEIAAVKKDYQPRAILLEDQIRIYAPILSLNDHLIGVTLLQLSPKSLQSAMLLNIQAGSISAFLILILCAFI